MPKYQISFLIIKKRNANINKKKPWQMSEYAPKPTFCNQTQCYRLSTKTKLPLLEPQRQKTNRRICALGEDSFAQSDQNVHWAEAKNAKYSITSMARTRMARLPWMIQSLQNSSNSSRK